MSRIIPALPFTLPMPPRAAPRAPIKYDDEQWDSIPAAANLAYATVHAQPVYQQGWTNGQWTRNVGAFEAQLRFRIPYLSNQHLAVRCHVFGYSTSSNGEVKFSSVNAGNSVTVNVNAAVTGWFSSAAPHLDLTGGFGPHAGDIYEEITVEGKNDLTVLQVCVEYLDVNPAGNYPGVADALPAGPTSDLRVSHDFVPLDNVETFSDKPLASDVMKRWDDTLEILDARPWMHYCWSRLENPNGGGAYDHMVHHPHRVVVPVKPGGTTLQVWAYASGTGGTDGEVWIQHGSGGALDIARRGPRMELLQFPTASGAHWQSATIRLPDDREFGAPRRVPGFTQVAVLPGDGDTSGDTELYSVSIWGV